MSRVAFLLLFSVACVGALARGAAAGVTVDLVFTKHNGAPVSTPTITASPGDTLEMAIRLRNDIALQGFGVSLDFDPGPRDELDVVLAVEWRGLLLTKSLFFGPGTGLDPPSDPGPLGTGRIQSFHGIGPPRITGGVLPAGGNYQIGTVTWVVSDSVATNGADIASGLLNVGFDGVLGGAFEDVTSGLVFNAATVNAVAGVPSLSAPGAAAAVVLILASVCFASARGRRESKASRPPA